VSFHRSLFCYFGSYPLRVLFASWSLHIRCSGKYPMQTSVGELFEPCYYFDFLTSSSEHERLPMFVSFDTQEKLKLAARSSSQRKKRLTSDWSQIPTFAPYEIFNLILELLFSI
jgi:hypothetical protein